MLKDWRQAPTTRWLLARGPQAGSHLERVTPIGAHPIRGLAEPVELFALPAVMASARRSA